MIREPAELREDRSLAVHGGRAPRELPPQYSGVVPDAAESVAGVVRSGSVTTWSGGGAKEKLESQFARMMQRRHACFVNSGSAALLLALVTLRGDELGAWPVGVTASYVSAINAVYHAGARPVFLPTDPQTLVASTRGLPAADRKAECLLATHFLGNGVDVAEIQKTIGAKASIVDASQALGATVGEAPMGVTGDVVCFSGSFRKLLGAGTGGIAVFDDARLELPMKTLARHGIDPNEIPALPGYSFWGGEIEATLALAALSRLNERVRQRRETVSAMTRVLDQAGIDRAQPTHVFGDHTLWFKVAVMLPETWLGHRDWLIEALRAEGVPAWRYPALIALPWVKPWMQRMGWWGDWEQHVCEHEQSIWDRVLTVDTQITANQGLQVAETLTGILTR